MVLTPAIVVKKLLAIRKKHIEYFLDNDLRIKSCVKIIWVKPYSAHVINDCLPDEIISDIEEMFWVEDCKPIEILSSFQKLEEIQQHISELNDSLIRYRENHQRFKQNMSKFVNLNNRMSQVYANASSIPIQQLIDSLYKVS